MSRDGDGGASERRAWVAEALRETQVVDVHTHLFPPSHGELMLWGVDSLLTYHYLVAELLTTPPPGVDAERFFALPREAQAEMVWDQLFVKQTPLSEACRGVLTTLQRLGLEEQVRARDLGAIRRWFATQDREDYCERVFRLSRVKYCVMTNIPFDEAETRWWDEPRAKAFSARFKAAVRVDPLLKGDWTTVRAALERQGFATDVPGARAFLAHWARKTDALYLMASTPAGFRYLPEQAYASPDTLEMQEAGRHEAATELLDKVLLPAARELRLALALKLGAVRGVNPRLNPCGGGDGVERADLGFVTNLARGFPDVKILLTVLSRENQHELAVLANKFSNVHVYGCWWYCNVPSVIDETMRLRVEMLGTAHTAQHSDARVLDQLIYKWDHSRQLLGQVLNEKYDDLARTGWQVTQAEVARDVERLLGGAFEAFLAAE